MALILDKKDDPRVWGFDASATQQAQPASRGRVAIVEVLRGLAALAVCWFHLTGSAGPAPTIVRSSGRLGWAGVEIFFVISGFVLPLSLWSGRYRVQDFARFLVKRILRVDPPYLASILAAFVLSYLVAHLPGTRAVFEVPTMRRTLAHLAYAIPFVPNEYWFSPVYWTLGIEFQYYLLLAISFRGIATQNRHAFLGLSVLILLLGAAVPAEQFLPRYGTLFLMGIAVFRERVGLSPRADVGAVIIASAVCATLLLGPIHALTGVLTAALIYTNPAIERTPVSKPFFWLGSISYSLYLLHWAFGITTVAATRRALHASSESTILGFATRIAGLVAALVAAQIMYAVIEKPALRAAARVRYSERVGRDVVSSAQPDNC